MNLDRFSKPLAGETYFSSEDFHELYGEEENEPITCCGCGIEIDETEEIIESEYYEDHYLHSLEECKIKYEMILKTKKDPSGTDRSFEAV